MNIDSTKLAGRDVRYLLSDEKEFWFNRKDLICALHRFDNEEKLPKQLKRLESKEFQIDYSGSKKLFIGESSLIHLLSDWAFQFPWSVRNFYLNKFIPEVTGRFYEVV